MLSTTLVGLLLSCVVVLLSSSGWCYQTQHRHSSPSSFSGDEQQKMFLRQAAMRNRDDDYPRVFSSSAEDMFEDSSSAENDSAMSPDELSVLLPSLSGVSKRRRGPTLSVVNPLEVLRQRLMLDLAKQRIRENQKQIVANGELLEKIGKRSSRVEEEEEEDQP